MLEINFVILDLIFIGVMMSVGLDIDVYQSKKLNLLFRFNVLIYFSIISC